MIQSYPIVERFMKCDKAEAVVETPI
ncbi:hypothetical protein FP2506_15859 [Fulvimarina pelagi HTCC2506]|uniref:Uncharacterized protein n=1 Tax=Fulvimarina pelagi HTCC2506 TaxID=314231 RepID=Q0G3A8_9HYPH|nr:hypothetical protein FP2506_15859 [Fulvimarina pelagi HTCC2506]